MRKQILLIIFTTALVVATLGIATAFAMAETPASTVALTTVTPDYYEWGNLLAMTASGDEVAVVHRTGDNTYLCAWGNTVDITDRLQTTDDRIHMAMTQNGVLLYLGGDKLVAYNRQSGLTITAIPCGYKESLSTRPFTAMAVDDGTLYTQPTLYLGYGTLIARIAWDKAMTATTEDEFKQNIALVAEVDNATHSYKRMGWNDGELYLYGDDAYFALQPTPEAVESVWQVTPAVTVPAMQRYAPFAGGVSLRDGALGTADTGAAVIAEDASADATIEQGVHMTLAAGGQYLAVADNRTDSEGVVHGAVKLYDSDYRLVRLLGDYGAMLGKLNRPDYFAAQQLAVVRDAGNQRIVAYDPQTKRYYDLPARGDGLLCATIGNCVYVGQGHLVTLYRCDQTVTSQAVFNLPDAQVVSLAADEEGAYVLADNGKLYNLQLSATQPVVKDSGIACQGVSAVVAGKHTGVLYLRFGDGVHMYKDGQALNLTFALPVDCLAWDVDYCGNLYALCADGITVNVYRRTTEGYGLETVTLADAVVGLAISQDGEVYAGRAHAMMAVELPVRSRNNAAYDHPALKTPVRAVRVEGEGTVWGYTSPDNYESVVGITGGSCAMLIAPHTYGGQDYYYIEYTVRTGVGERHEKVYVPQTRATMLADGQPDTTRVRYNGVDAQTGVYAYPANSAQPIERVAAADAQWDVVRIVGMDGDIAAWPWYEIVYGQGTAYVRMVNYVSVQPANPQVPRYYAHAKANRLGESVLVYASPDTDSNVLASLVDGSSIELVAPFDKNTEWTLVRYEGQEAYVLTANISTGGLTNGQLFAVIMTVVVVCAAAVTVLLYLLAKRRK